MSGQYPGGYNSPHGGHRGQFNSQQQQQHSMNQMGGMNMGQGSGLMMQLGGYGQGGMMQQQQQQNSIQPGGNVGVMNTAGMQSPSHIHQHQQHQQQQQQMGMGSSQMNMGGVPISGSGSMAFQSSQQPQPGISSMPQQSVQQQHTNQSHPPLNSNMYVISQPNPHKEINIVALSRLGQETVQDITSRFQEIYAALKIIQPTSNRDNNTEKKVQEYFRTIRLLFKRVRIIYEKCNDSYPQGMEYANIEGLIPYKDEPEHRNEATQCEEYRKAMQENQELIETVKLKNRQLREIIDRTRIIIWEINTMLSMRRS